MANSTWTVTNIGSEVNASPELALSEQSLPSTASLIFLTFAGYVLSCLVLRYRRRDSIQNSFAGRSLSSMTDDEAHSILKRLNQLEFPFMYYTGLQVALLRTYGIPTIAKLLKATTQLSKTTTVGKRYADTAALMNEIYANPPTTDRGMEAFGRLNFLHSHYISKGLISNDDMLYTLALFMNHPVRMVSKYEWRELTSIEICAMGQFHLNMGRAMEIDLSCLPGSDGGWTDGLHFYTELDQWAEAYERQVMVPNVKSQDVAARTVEFLSSTYPKFMHSGIERALSAVVDGRLREALGFEEPGFLASVIVECIFAIRKVSLRYLSPPRPEFLKSKQLAEGLNADGKRNVTFFEGLPVYVQPTLWNRYGPSSWSRRLLGLPLPGDEGMIPQGYTLSNVGPDFFDGKGAAEAEATVQRLRREHTGGCPFAILK